MSLALGLILLVIALVINLSAQMVRWKVKKSF